MIEVNLSERFNASCTYPAIICISEFCKFFNNKLDELGEMIMMVNKNLKQIFNSYALILAQLKYFKVFLSESLIVCSVVNQSSDYIFQNTYNLIV